MPATIIARTITVSLDDDGHTIRATKGDMWQTTDENGNPIEPKHIGTKNNFTADELAAIFPQGGLVAQVGALQADKAALVTERDALKAQTDAVPALTQERDALASDKAVLTQERDALVAAKSAWEAEQITLRAQVIELMGTPKFQPSALIALFTPDDVTAIITTVVGSVDLRALYYALSNRAATGDAPIPISSPTFQAGLAGLQTALGEARVTELFTALNIDLAAGRYINP